MNCPRCDIPMADGTIVVRGSFARSLLYGLSSQPLWWRSPGDRDIKLMEPRRPKRAWRCERCTILVVP